MKCVKCINKIIDENKKPFGEYFICNCEKYRKEKGFNEIEWYDIMCNKCAEYLDCCPSCGLEEFVQNNQCKKCSNEIQVEFSEIVYCSCISLNNFDTEYNFENSLIQDEDIFCVSCAKKKDVCRTCGLSRNNKL